MGSCMSNDLMARGKDPAALRNSSFRVFRYVLTGGNYLGGKKAANKQLCITLGLPWRKLCVGTHGSTTPATCKSCSGHPAVKTAALEKRAQEKSSNGPSLPATAAAKQYLANLHTVEKKTCL